MIRTTCGFNALYWQAINFILILIVFLSFQDIFAHEGHNKQSKPDSVKIQDTTALKNSSEPEAQLKQEVIVQNEEKEFEIELSQAFFEHLHNKIIHFPIAFLIGAFIISIIDIKKKQYGLIINLFLAMGLFAAIAAFITGSNQMTPFVGTNKEWIVNLHRGLGITTIFMNLLWLLFFNIKALKKFSIAVGLITVLIISIVGFYGGVIAH